MLNNKLLVLVTGSVLLVGCNEQDMSGIESRLTSIQGVSNQIRSTVNREAISTEHQLSKDIATNRRLASIASYFLTQENVADFTPGIQKQVLLASAQVKADAYRDVKYKAMEMEGFFNTVMPVGSDANLTSSYLVQGKWRLDVVTGSDFDNQYPTYAIKALQYERVPFDDAMCSEGEPVAIHALMKDASRAEQLSTPDVVIHKEGQAWRIDIQDVDFSSAIKDYRVLLDVRCVVR
ncbi:hypothetical protein AAFX24_28005 [Vibrio mediterranei]|uniref:hypothetical protein n=1 Tax=Vibrio mediterranei TaxID=689 RepID=UPI0038CEA013